MEKTKIKTVRILARLGCISIGVVYALVGLLALLNLFNLSNKEADEEGTLEFIKELPLGVPVLWAITLMLLGYIIWRVYESIADPYNYGNDFKAMVVRGGIGATGLAYAAISISAFTILLGGKSNGEDDQKALASDILEWDYGAWVLGAAALIALATGLVQFVYGAKNKFLERLDIGHLVTNVRKSITALGKIGYFARGAILLIISIFIAKAAWFSDPDEIGSTKSAFEFMNNGWAGKLFFAAVAFGTLIYGLFMFIFARYYNFQPED